MVLMYSLEAAIFTLLALVRLPSGDIFTAVMSFPFEQLGLALRWMSLSGGIGNAIAVIIYMASALAPLIIMLVMGRRRGRYPEDWLLALLSAMLFAVLYQMINPGLLVPAGSDAAIISVAKAIAGSTIYSLLCAYIVLRLLRLFAASETERLKKYALRLLFMVNAVFVYLIFGSGISGLLVSIQELRAANVGYEHLLGTGYLFLVLKFAVDSIPIALNIAVVFSGISLLRALEADRYSQEAVDGAQRLSKICKISLAATVLGGSAFNALQFVFKSSLNNISTDVQIPLFSILFVLAALLLSRFATENKALKDDNDSII